MKLHIGCGDKHLCGYKNVDIRYLPNVDVVDNAMYLRKFINENIDEIYACHVLEHFSRWEVNNVLKRWHAILNLGGVIRISVPDFEAISQYYEATKDLRGIMGLLYGGQDYNENFHCCCWDFSELTLALMNAGFSEVALYNWKDFLPDGFDDYSRCYLPHKDFEHGKLMSLNVWARV